MKGGMEGEREVEEGDGGMEETAEGGRREGSLWFRRKEITLMRKLYLFLDNHTLPVPPFPASPCLSLPANLLFIDVVDVVVVVVVVSSPCVFSCFCFILVLHIFSPSLFFLSFA